MTQLGAANLTLLHSGFTIDEQIVSLEYVRKAIALCLGYSAGDTYRAYSRGAAVLGFKLDVHRGVFRDATLYGEKEAVRRHPNVIRPGEMLATVYFATDSTGDLLKIGHSVDPVRRVQTLTRLTGRTLDIIARRKGFRLNELCYQLAARSAWVGGEWFDLRLLRNDSEWQWLFEPKAIGVVAP